MLTMVSRNRKIGEKSRKIKKQKINRKRNEEKQKRKKNKERKTKKNKSDAIVVHLKKYLFLFLFHVKNRKSGLVKHDYQKKSVVPKHHSHILAVWICLVVSCVLDWRLA